MPTFPFPFPFMFTGQVAGVYLWSGALGADDIDRIEEWAWSLWGE